MEKRNQEILIWVPLWNACSSSLMKGVCCRIGLYCFEVMPKSNFACVEYVTFSADMIERFRVTFAANGKRQAQIENFPKQKMSR